MLWKTATTQPDSMKAAIRTFGSMKRPKDKPSRKILVMGDMLELGDYSKQAHYEAGQCAAQEDIDIIFCLVSSRLLRHREREKLAADGATKKFCTLQIKRK